MVADINAGAAGSSIRILSQGNGMLTFAADDGIHGSELWVTDGTTRGTKLVRDINTTPVSPITAIAVVDEVFRTLV